MKTVWLSLGAIVAAVVAACAAGEDNSEVQVAAETNLPQCNSGPPQQAQASVPDPPNTEQRVDNNGNIILGGSSSGRTGSSGSSAAGSSSSGDTAKGSCPTSGTSSSSSSGTASQ